MTVAERILTMGDRKIQLALRQMEVEDLIALLRRLEKPAQDRVYLNLSARAAKAAMGELALRGSAPPSQKELAAYARAESFITTFQEMVDTKLPPFDSGEIHIQGNDPEELMEALAKTADLARAEGIASVAALAKDASHPLLRYGLSLMGETSDPEIFEECLSNQLERHRAEQRFLDESLKDSLIKIFYGGSSDDIIHVFESRQAYGPASKPRK